MNKQLPPLHSWSSALIATIVGFGGTIALVVQALRTLLMSSMENMLANKSERDVALLTFLTTGSGVVVFGLGSAFWGLVVGFLAFAAKKALRPAD